MLCLLIGVGQVSAQFWIGPKVGGTLSSQVYQDKSFKNFYDTKAELDWHLGASLDYESESRFTVHSEITYERISRDLRTKPEDSANVYQSQSVFHFLSVPMTVRIVFAGHRKAVKFYGQAGPRLRYWIAGNGKVTSNNYREAGFDGYYYKVAFTTPDQRNENFTWPENPNGPRLARGKQYIVDANRLQYSLDWGAGMIVDLANGQRLNVDLRFSWGHSNMGFNRTGDDIGEDLGLFDDDQEYRNNLLTLSVAYLFAFDPLMINKGKSTQKK